MLFTTIEFSLFFLAVLPLNWLLRVRTVPYKLFLLAANAIFYASLDYRFLPLLLVVGLSNWFFAGRIVRTRKTPTKKILLALDVALNLGLLAFFKYYEFFYTELESFLLAMNWSNPLPVAEIIFPVGISFYTFQGISYIVDVYRDPSAKVEKPVDLLLFVSFFPTVLSGPIMRARDFIPQITRPNLSSRAFNVAFALILSGMFKKIVIASFLSEHIVRQVFQVPANYSSLTVLAAVYGYSIQIYCDFSGYSDLAIGLALLLGYHIPDNFQAPYTATNLQEFWHRWHISLSTWLRDYLYIPLGGSRKSTFRKYLNLMITMVLGGLWHGAHSRFLLWGGLHGLGLVITHLVRDGVRKIRRGRKPARRSWPGRAVLAFLGWLFTFHAVSFLWVFFRAEDSQRAFEIFRAVLACDQPGGGFQLLVIPAILVGLGMQFFGETIRETYLLIQERLPVPLKGALIALLTVIILRLGPEGVLPFIYFQF